MNELLSWSINQHNRIRKEEEVVVVGYVDIYLYEWMDVNVELKYWINNRKKTS